MNMQAKQAPMMVTVAKAAEILTAAGDRITAPNVSRYLDRHSETIPSEKRGRVRLVDIVVLAEHRKTNVFVADKQADRGLEPAQPVRSPSAADVSAPLLDAGEDDGGDLPDSLKAINLELRKLELTRRRREEDMAAGRLVPDKEVVTIVSTVLSVINASLERREIEMTQKFGREVGAASRGLRKAAMADGAGRLAELAQRHLPPTLAAQVADATPAEG